MSSIDSGKIRAKCLHLVALPIITHHLFHIADSGSLHRLHNAFVIWRPGPTACLLCMEQRQQHIQVHISGHLVACYLVYAVAAMEIHDTPISQAR
jgi:hypothetical protein